jgi:hypothetical protein
MNIVLCTMGSRSIAPMLSSICEYGGSFGLHVFRPMQKTFGESYNIAMTDAFSFCDEMIIANDDVVLWPNTMQLLIEDVIRAKMMHGDKAGFVAARADNIRPPQRIRLGENCDMERARFVSPVFAWLSKKAFETARFPPLNWFSDDVMCEDLNRQGFVHYFSRACIHHAGSLTIGGDYSKHINEARPWIRENRPEYESLWF